MTTHVLALTYAPKIEAVKAGTCRQTIRRFNPLKPKKVGDKLILHTWAGKPYRTPWDWRLETNLTFVGRIHLIDGVWFMESVNIPDKWYPSEDMVVHLATRDGIDPPTREGLEATLKRLNDLASLEYTQWDVIRW